MTDSERAKAALAALADGEPARPDYTGTGDRHPSAGDSAEPSPATPETGGRTDRDAYQRVIERAVAATEDVEAAAEFVDDIGLDRLEDAVDRAEHEVSGLAEDGREALVTFERFRVAAQGPVEE